MKPAYYNEFDHEKAEWLRELIKRGLIADGDVDERSIHEVKGSDLAGYTQVHLFAGIGIWSHALRLAGWSDDRPVWTGSCPCQSFSTAGQRKGEFDSRHLWPEMLRLIRECRPSTVFGEQVAAAIGHGWLDRVFVDLEAEGYACGASVLSGPCVGAPHIRDRIYWMANSRHQPVRRVASAGEAIGARIEIAGRGDVGGLADASGARRYGEKREPESDTRDEARLRMPRPVGDAGGIPGQDAGEEGHAGSEPVARERESKHQTICVGGAVPAREIGRILRA